MSFYLLSKIKTLSLQSQSNTTQSLIRSTNNLRKQTIGATLLTYIGFIVGAINVLFILPKCLSLEEIGMRTLLLNSAFFIGPLSRLGITNVIIRYFPYYKENERDKGSFLFFILTVPLIGFLILATVFLLFKNLILSLYIEKSILVAQYYYYLLPLSFFIMYLGVLEYYSQVHHKLLVSAFARQLFVPLASSLSAILYFAGLINFTGFIQFLILIFALTCLFNILNILSIGQLKLKPNFSVFRQSTKNGIPVYAAYSSVYILSPAVIAGFGSIMMSSIAGLSATGIFAIAYFIGTILNVPQRVLSTATSPLLGEAWKNKELLKIKSLYKKTSILQMTTGLFLFALIWTNIDSIFSLMPHSSLFIQGKWALLLIAIGTLLDVSSGNNTDLIITSDKYKFNLISILLLLVVMIVSNYFLIKYFEINGAGLACLLSIIFYNAIKFVFIYIKFRIQPFSTQSVKVLFIGILAMLVAYYIPTLNAPIIDIAVKSFLISIIMIPLVILLKISPDITNYFHYLRNYFSINKK